MVFTKYFPTRFGRNLILTVLPVVPPVVGPAASLPAASQSTHSHPEPQLQLVRPASSGAPSHWGGSRAGGSWLGFLLRSLICAGRCVSSAAEVKAAVLEAHVGHSQIGEC